MEAQTAFLQTFGESPVLKVLDFLIVNEDFDHSMTDIARHSGVGYSTLKLFWGKAGIGCIEKLSIIAES
ncbi:hypothetical protein HYU15_04380 [Candidatus Woesearchaeota archaeon]|nr:hypothetical protein [Candidatus Woesearchaeota archaeon]